MGSKWAGTVEGAFFDPVLFDRNRIINMAETHYSKRTSLKTVFYILGVDVGRYDDMTEIAVIKVTTNPNGYYVKNVVNFFTYQEPHFGQQAIYIKRLFNKFNCEAVVVDGNGPGEGLIDFLILDQYDPDNNDPLYGFGVRNDKEGRFKKYRTPNTIRDALTIIKANQVINSELYSYCQAQMRNGRIKFLVDENIAKNKLMSQKQGQNMSAVQRAEYLRPYVETSILKSQLINLVVKGDGPNVILDRSSRKIKKDKVSALVYGLSFVKEREETMHKRGSRDLSGFSFFTKH